MIVAEAKPIKELLEMVKDFKKILVVGCKGCVTVCNVGGAREVAILASSIRISRKKEHASRVPMRRGRCCFTSSSSSL